MIRTTPLALVLSLLATCAYAQSPADPYYTAGEAALARSLAVAPNTGRARNIILFIGDGMGISTITAARIFDAQERARKAAEKLAKEKGETIVKADRKSVV